MKEKWDVPRAGTGLLCSLSCACTGRGGQQGELKHPGAPHREPPTAWTPPKPGPRALQWVPGSAPCTPQGWSLHPELHIAFWKTCKQESGVTPSVSPGCKEILPSWQQIFRDLHPSWQHYFISYFYIDNRTLACTSAINVLLFSYLIKYRNLNHQGIRGMKGALCFSSYMMWFASCNGTCLMQFYAAAFHHLHLPLAS